MFAVNRMMIIRSMTYRLGLDSANNSATDYDCCIILSIALMRKSYTTRIADTAKIVLLFIRTN